MLFVATDAFNMSLRFTLPSASSSLSGSFKKKMLQASGVAWLFLTKQLMVWLSQLAAQKPRARFLGCHSFTTQQTSMDSSIVARAVFLGFTTRAPTYQVINVNIFFTPMHSLIK